MTTKHGKVYWSAGIVSALMAGAASYAVTRFQVEALERRQAQVEASTAGLATKVDVMRVEARLDDVYRVLINRRAQP